LTWFFHYSGVDLVIGRDREPGGVLIRAIENVETKEKIYWSTCCALELLNQQIDIEGNKRLKLELVSNNEELQCSMITNKRVGLGTGEFNEARYNFSTK
jgi:3-methyladenine DNA glycosylase Mpg